MFTLAQIQAAHAKVKSGADFPAYVQELIQLGVRHYENFVSDGHTQYVGQGDYTVSSSAKYPTLEIASEINLPQFQVDLKAHQQGQSDYLTFCGYCAKLGVEKWQVSMEKMTCTYFDQAGNEVLVEQIPE